MKVAILTFPGSNCDRDLFLAFKKRPEFQVVSVWHKDTVLPENVDLCAIPGGFSFGDYLRSGAIAAKSPIMASVVKFAKAGGYVLGVCNGFQILTETDLLPGVLLRNDRLTFICKDQKLIVENTDSIFTNLYVPNIKISIPIAHHDGNYSATQETLESLHDSGRIAFTYADSNPNGSMSGIAGILSKNKRILGMMPHPERCTNKDSNLNDGEILFNSIINALQ